MSDVNKPNDATTITKPVENPTQNVVTDMMKNSPTEVANTIKQMSGDAGSGTASLPKVTIAGLDKGQGCGGDEHGGGCSPSAPGKSHDAAGGGASANGDRAGGGASASRGEARPFHLNQHGSSHAGLDVSVPAPTALVTHH
jgi:hypothetical protein